MSPPSLHTYIHPFIPQMLKKKKLRKVFPSISKSHNVVLPFRITPKRKTHKLMFCIISDIHFFLSHHEILDYAMERFRQWYEILAVGGDWEIEKEEEVTNISSVISQPFSMDYFIHSVISSNKLTTTVLLWILPSLRVKCCYCCNCFREVFSQPYDSFGRYS